MSWEDRLREAAYTAPGGTRQTFLYEDVTQLNEKRTTAFNFPDADGTYVQDLGNTGRRYPLRVIFSGADYDLEAAAFEALLRERGVGRLEHPAYGTRDVVPFGIFSRRDDLKTAANQAIIEVAFWETIDLIFPANQADPATEVITTVDEFNEATAEQFELTTTLDSAVDKATFEGSYLALLDRTQIALRNIAAVEEKVEKQFDTINASINQGIDVLIAEPLTLAFQTSLFIQSAARAPAAIADRLDAYRNLVNTIITGDSAIATPGLSAQNSNEFHGNDLFVSTYQTGSILSVVNNQFETKSDALNAAEEILTQLENITNWRDDNFESLGEVDTGESYQQLQAASAIAAGFLVQISFSLKQEIRFTLDRDRTIIDLVAELYGSIDENLDFFIRSNALTGSEILELPRGRDIVYYI